MTILGLLMAVFEITSCNRDDLQYSCDPEINAWVLEHRIEYADISRDQLILFDYEQQRGLFASFSPEQKVKIYQSKYHYLMGLNTLSKEEKEWLTIVFQRVTPNIYSSKKERLDFIDFSEKWTYEVIEKLGWEPVDVYRYTHTWMTNDEFEHWLDFKRNQESTSSGSTRDVQPKLPCECYWDISCLWALNYCEKDEKCTTTDGGCGVANTTNCNGHCISLF